MTKNRKRDRREPATTNADPTENPEFQKVVGYFLRTKPKPHKDEKPKRPKTETLKKGKPAK